MSEKAGFLVVLLLAAVSGDPLHAGLTVQFGFVVSPGVMGGNSRPSTPAIEVHKVNLRAVPGGRMVGFMSTYGQFCPVALGAEIFAERWTPLIVRELLHGGRRFSDIHRGVPRISKNLLVQRLESLERSGIITRHAAANGRGHLYELSTAGRELGSVIEALGTWGYKWAAKDLTDEQLDPDFLMWALRRMVRVDALPEQRVVVLFRFRGHKDRQYWLVLQRPEVDLCLIDPGHEVNLTLEAETEAMAHVCLGHFGLMHAVRSGDVELMGPPRYRRAIPEWLGVTRFAALAKST